MRDLNYQLKMLCKHSHEGSFETRVGRERQLSAIANQLHDLGFWQMKATSLKQKHVQALVDHWLGQNLSPGTIKNRMSCLRWWAEKVNKRAVVAGSNDHYGIPDRQFVSDQSKAKDLTREQFTRVKDERVRMSLRLQQAFGLRREEALKIQPRWADRAITCSSKPVGPRVGVNAPFPSAPRNSGPCWNRPSAWSVSAL
jgi:site-specific recombinase XerC